MSEVAIETVALTKQYDATQGWRRNTRSQAVSAVTDVTLRVARGELFGLLGPNGAGKTTLVKMLSTLVLPTSGTLQVNGYGLEQAEAIRASVGLVVSDERSFYWRLTARRNLHFFAAMYGLYGSAAAERVDAVLGDVDLSDKAEERFSNFSSGMRQRLAIARALLHRPTILFLDEPTRSLDPLHTQRLHDLILHFIETRGMTVFLITHDLAEAEKLCDRVAIMHKGRVQAVGESAELRRRLQPRQKYTLTLTPVPDQTRLAVEALAPDARFDRHQVTFYAPERGPLLTQVLDTLRDGGVTIDTIHGRPPTLEELFAVLTDSAEGAASSD